MSAASWLTQVVTVTEMNLRNLPSRLGTSLVAVVGIGGVVAVLVSLLAMGEGFRAALDLSGRDDVALILHTSGSTGRPKRWRVRTGRGTQPRERRMTSGRPATTRATESSQREAMGRSCSRKRSAIDPRRERASASSKAMGSSERLPLVMTSGTPASARSSWWSGA